MQSLSVGDLCLVCAITGTAFLFEVGIFLVLGMI